MIRDVLRKNMVLRRRDEDPLSDDASAVLFPDAETAGMLAFFLCKGTTMSFPVKVLSTVELPPGFTYVDCATSPVDYWACHEANVPKASMVDGKLEVHICSLSMKTGAEVLAARDVAQRKQFLQAIDLEIAVKSQELSSLNAQRKRLQGSDGDGDGEHEQEAKKAKQDQPSSGK